MTTKVEHKPFLCHHRIYHCATQALQARVVAAATTNVAFEITTTIEERLAAVLEAATAL